MFWHLFIAIIIIVLIEYKPVRNIFSVQKRITNIKTISTRHFAWIIIFPLVLKSDFD